MESCNGLAVGLGGKWNLASGDTLRAAQYNLMIKQLTVALDPASLLCQHD